MKNWRHIFFYKPYGPYIIVDVVLLVLSFLVVLAWFPLTTQIPFQKYDIFALVFSSMWLLMNYLTHRYVPVKFMRIGTSMLRLLLSAVLVFVLMNGYMFVLAGFKNYSIYVLLTIWGTVFAFSALFVLLSHAYFYALYAEPEIERGPERGEQKVLYPPRAPQTEAQKENLRESIRSVSSDYTERWLEKHFDLFSSNTYTLYTSELYNIQKLHFYRFDLLVNLMPLNQIRGINKMLGLVNDRLPDQGRFVCCFETQSTRKKNFLAKYPPVLNWIFYAFFSFYKRVLPKLVMTSRLYYDITEGKNRVLSRTEVLGRLYYCGFKVLSTHKVEGKLYVVAERDFRPKTVARRMYGVFVKLRRLGKGGKVFNVYKFRTMHPYAEYIQAYIYEHYGLQAGGKFERDIRVTTLGHCMRKYWVDEWPMLANLFKGDMKLVGVRPISEHYFSLYSKQLQEQRLRHKPGLLPPFYADMPKTLEQIEASEIKYLTRCEQKGTFATDFVYFWKIVGNILFRRAHSN